MLGEGDAPAIEGGSVGHRWQSRVTVVAALLVVGFFVLTYGYNAISFDKDSLISDQWVWVESVLIPYHQGDMSLFSAVTWEFAPMSHSHIPALIVFLFSFEFLHLDLSPDRIIGFLSLGAALVIVFRHARGFLRLDTALLVTAVASSLLFVSSSATNFEWSLLQLQMFYVLVALVYLRSFAIRHEMQPGVHALIAVPATLLLGDAIGVAAVVATLAYLGVLGLMRRAPKRALVAYFGLFPLQLLVLSAVLRGERLHGEGSLLDSIQNALSNPGQYLKGLYYSLATIFVALRPTEFAGPLLGWAHAPLWFALTVAIGGVAAVLVWRSPLRTHDRFPILIILTGLIWILGVLRARIFRVTPALPRSGISRSLLGAETMQAPWYATYTALIGVGLVLLLASKLRFQPSLRTPLVGLAAVVVLANGLGSLKLIDNQVWVDEQQRELTELRAYVLDETQEFDPRGRRCSRGASCLRAAWFLYDEKLAAFRGDDAPRATWESPLRNLAFDRFDDLRPEQRMDACVASALSDDHALGEWMISEPPFELRGAIQRAGLEIVDGEQAEADRLLSRLLRDRCGRPTEPRG